MKARWRRKLTLLAWHAWQRLDAVLPRPCRFFIATVVGELAYWLLPGKRAASLDNMRHALGPGAPEADIVLMAKRSFRNYAKYLCEFTHLPRWSEPDLEQLLAAVDGWEHVADALSDNKGAIMVTPHFGNWDIAGWIFGQRYTFAAVAEPLEPPELDALVQGWRQAKHIGIIPLATAARGALRVLRGGGIVALVVDRPTHARGEGVWVRFFGEWTRVPAGAAHFALKTGVPVVAAGVWRTPANLYAAFALPPRRFQPGADTEHDLAHVMQAIMSDVETIIRAHPDQWYMFRRMWPQRPQRGVISSANGWQERGDEYTGGPALARAASAWGADIAAAITAALGSRRRVGHGGPTLAPAGVAARHERSPARRRSTGP